MENNKDSYQNISAYLQEEFELEVDEIREMVEEYLTNIQSFIQNAKEQAANQQFDQLAKDSHCQKGASLNLEARYMANLCKKVELAAKAGDSENCKLYLDEMTKNCQALENDFQNNG